MNQFLTAQYYFTTQPDPNFHFTKITLAVAIIFIFLGFISEFYRKKRVKDKIARKILRPYPAKLIWYGMIVILLLAVREAGIQYLSMRIWWFVLFAFMIFSAVRLLFTYKTKYNERRKTLKIALKEDKYLPKKKK